MPLPNATYVICFTAILFMHLVISLNTTNCQTGWFGTRCQYKCRCTDYNCDTEGLCMNNNTCLGGWFGPACQYLDMAYNQSSVSILTDGNDQTCLNQTITQPIVLPLNAIFTWLRFVSRNTSYDQEFILSFRENTSINDCSTQQTSSQYNGVMDIHCPSNETVDEVLVSGQGIHSLCSIYISGGRNIALKQTARQSSVYTVREPSGEDRFYSADKAVDGNTTRHFFAGKSCSHTMRQYPIYAFWTVSLKPPGHVIRYVVHNRDNGTTIAYSIRLMGFILESFNENGEQIFSFKDTHPGPLPVYTVHSDVRSVAKVKITVAKPSHVLTLCEVEVYGDSQCPLGYYGRECDKECNCLVYEECFTSTGGCPSGCALGYIGLDCRIPCPVSHYGFGCEYNCSQNCAPGDNLTTCNHVSGQCFNGCIGAFHPPKCENVCDPASYGPSCKLRCSPTCADPSSDSYNICDNHNGTCLYGCDNGYHGAKCTAACMTNKYGKDCKLYCSHACIRPKDKNSSPCNHINGSCDYGCATGFSGSLCNNDTQTEIVIPTTDNDDDNKESHSFNFTTILIPAGAFFLVFAAFVAALLLVLKRHPSAEDED